MKQFTKTMSAVLAAAAMPSLAGCFVDYANDCSYNVALPCHKSSGGSGGSGDGTGGTGGGSSTGTAGSGGQAPTNTVVVVYKRNLLDPGLPVPGVTIAVNDESGAVVTEAKTDSDGKAEVVVPPGGSVTALQLDAIELSAQTVVAPPAGAEIRFEGNDPEEDTFVETLYAVTPTGYPAATKKFLVRCGCGIAQGFPGKDTTFYFSRCYPYLDYKSHDCIVTAEDDNGPIAWGISLGHPENAAATVSFPVKINGADFATVHAYVSKGLSSTTVWAGVSSDSSDAQMDASAGTSDSDSAPVDVVLKLPLLTGSNPTFKYSIRERVALQDKSLQSGSIVLRVRTFDKLPSTSTFSLNEVPLVTMQPMDVSDPAHPELQWTLNGQIQMDVILLQVYWKVGLTGVSYRIRLPPDHASSFRIPDVPEAFQGFVLTSGPIGAYANYQDYFSLDGYAQALSMANPTLWWDDGLVSTGYTQVTIP